MRHAQPRPSMTYMNLFLVDATFGLGVKISRTLGVRMKLHGPLASDWKFMHPRSQCETSGTPGRKVKIEPLVSEWNFMNLSSVWKFMNLRSQIGNSLTPGLSENSWTLGLGEKLHELLVSVWNFMKPWSQSDNHEPLVSEWNFMNRWSQSENSWTFDLTVELHASMVSEWNFTNPWSQS
jgi:hypothetical protein